jgi:type VI secretion system secreted protein VgrG
MDAPATLSKGPITLDPPPNGQSLVFRSMTAEEELGRLFEYKLDLLSRDPNLMASDMLGYPMTVHLELSNGDIRHFNGYVTDFSLAGTHGDYALYQVTLRPWLWLLTRTANCRIFQHKTVPDIVKQVFRDHGLTDFEDALAGNYPARDFVVQYRETDFNFVSRLMEQEGIYYFFKHDNRKHTLVLADSYSAHDAVPGYESLPYYPPDEHRAVTVEHVDRWRTSNRMKPGAYAITDYDFERPQANLFAKVSAPNRHPNADFEIFDYPGGYARTHNGEDCARIRFEELNSRFARADAETNARGLTVGALLKLTDHPVQAQNGEYLVIAGKHELRTHDPESGNGPDEKVYRCSFSVIESSRPFRTERVTRKPFVQGPQTAVVVGKAGEEIWTDSYGRVKVKFHWDRFANGDETSSCWVRVAQVWAGDGWGGIHIPRIGQEVIVDFLEGDPDCPIITGRVYNADNMPPYGLPADQTQSGLKSRSTKGGGAGNFNQLRFEDKRGAEEVNFQAEKDLNTLVKNNESHSVGADRSISVGHDETHTVTNNRTKNVNSNETVTIAANRTETVGSNETITIGANRTETVGSAETISIGATRTTTVAQADTLNVGASQTTNVAASQSTHVGVSQSNKVGATQTVTVGGAQTIAVGGLRTVTVGGAEMITVGAARKINVVGVQSTSIGFNDSLKVGRNLVIDAGNQVTIKTGEASIVMKKSGEIVIKGKEIRLLGTKISQN